MLVGLSGLLPAGKCFVAGLRPAGFGASVATYTSGGDVARLAAEERGMRADSTSADAVRPYDDRLTFKLPSSDAARRRRESRLRFKLSLLLTRRMDFFGCESKDGGCLDSGRDVLTADEDPVTRDESSELIVLFPRIDA